MQLKKIALILGFALAPLAHGQVVQPGGSSAVIPPAWPFTPQFAYLADKTPLAYPLTSIIDESGNGYNATPAGGFNQAPFHNAAGSGFQFIYQAAAQEKWATIPNAATCGVNTLIVLYTPYTANWADSNGVQYMLADANNSGLFIQNSLNILTPDTNGITQKATATDYATGNIATAFTMNGAAFPYGTPSSGTAFTTGSVAFNCGGAVSYLGHSGTGGGSPNATGFFGAIWAIAGFTQTLTLAQIDQALNYAEQRIYAYNGTAFNRPPQAVKVWYHGDSRSANFGSNYQMTTSLPYYVSQLNQNFAPFQTLGVSGNTLATVNLQSNGLGTMQISSNYWQVMHLDMIINDINSATCASAAACYTTIQTAGGTTYSNSLVPNMVKVYATPLPFALMSPGAETIREGTEALVITGQIAGTFNFQGVDDMYTDPLGATQSVPNSFLAIPATINVSSGSWTTGVQTIVLASPPPAYQCYAGSLLTFAGVNVTINGTRKLLSCSGSTVTFTLASTGGNPSTGTAQWTGNGNWYSDGTHEGPALNKELASQSAFSMQAALNTNSGNPTNCTVIQKQIPWQVPVVANTTTPALTQMVPLLQLFPGWQLCSLSINVTNSAVDPSATGAFVGPTTLTMSIGDSGGTATQYLGATNIKATGVTVASTPAFQSASGVVQLNFTATGTNVNTITTGNVNVSIGVMVRP